jgi:hypothetical protein
MMRHALFLATALGLAGAAFAQQHQHGGAPPACGDTSLACARVATPAFGPDGALWLVWAAGGRVMAARSSDLGHSFAAAIAVDREAERLDSGPDSRPKIVVEPDGRIAVAYAIFQDERYNGRVEFSRSTDGGLSFDPPRPITDDATSQRFEALTLDPGGGLFAAWLDKRNAVAARRKGENYPGAALAFAWMSGQGDAFSPAHIAADDTCECCRLAVAFAGPHRPVVLFRNIFGGTTRDHAVVTFADAQAPGPLYRVSVDDWKTNVCPHQGPSLAIGGRGTYHAAWFTDGQRRQGLFYARSLDGGGHFSDPMPLGSPDRRAARPYVFAQGDKVWLVWKEFDGEATVVRMRASGDDGVTWSSPATVAATADASDHPLLVGDGHRTYLSWLTRADGYRLVPLEGTP